VKPAKATTITTDRDGAKINVTFDISGETTVLSFDPADVPPLVMMLCAGMGQSAKLMGADQRERFLLPLHDMEVGVMAEGQVGLTLLPSPASRMSWMLDRGTARRLVESLEQALGTASAIPRPKRK
jgi:hypothetical protein